ncbi:MAG: methyltransferase domain-containing protein [Acidimicrobiales bacterium]
MTAALPDEGDILDWGCGHGLVALLAAEERPGRSVVGADIDVDKLETARRAATAAGFGDRVTFWDLVDGELPVGTWDAVAIVDMLYLLAPDAQEQLVHEAAACLAPGGVLVVKDLDDRPRLKAWLAAVQEAISVRVTRITATADGLHRPPGPARVERWMAAAGLATERQPCHRGHHVPHVLVVGTKPTVDQAGAPRRTTDALTLVHLCMAVLSESGGTFPF